MARRDDTANTLDFLGDGRPGSISAVLPDSSSLTVAAGPPTFIEGQVSAREDVADDILKYLCKSLFTVATSHFPVLGENGDVKPKRLNTQRAGPTRLLPGLAGDDLIF